MCLESIILSNLTKAKRSGLGWKVFRKDIQGFTFSYKPVEGLWDVPINRWIVSEPVRLMGDEFFYTSGFHIFKTREGARKWCGRHVEEVVVRVKYRRARILGVQNGSAVVVADEMLVLKPRKK